MCAAAQDVQNKKTEKDSSMPRVLVSDPIAPEGIARLKEAADVDVKIGLTKEELAAIIGDYDALAVRSQTKVTADVLANAHNLKIIGRAGVGVDNIDVEARSEEHTSELQ